MNGSSGALSQLKWLAERGATGEFICAAAPQEIHVYLQHGRVAWATSSAYPFEFARCIKERGNIDDDTLGEVLAECRRQRLPFGETLIAWGLVTWDDVRAALRHQIGLVFEQLAGLAGAQTMFLERKRFTEYNPEFTLDLASIAPEPAQAAQPASPGGAAPAAPAVTAPEPSRPEAAGRARQVLEAIRGAVWVEVLDGSRLCEAAPPDTRTSRVPGALIESTLGDGADFVAIRSARGSLVGARMRDGRGDVWCALSTEANYGSAVSALRSLGHLPGEDRARRRGATMDPGFGVSTWTVGDVRAGWGADLSLVLDSGHKVLAAIALRGDGQPRAGAARETIERDSCLALLARRAAVLASPDPIGPAARGGPDLKALGFSRMIVTGERGFWCFGAELGGGESVWVLSDRAALQGIGWACLTTLIRSVGRGEILAEAAAT